MQNLLRTILTELENHKLMFRANAYELWNYGCEDMIVPWGYDQDALIKTFKEVELDPRGGNIIIQHEDKCVEHKDLIARIKNEQTEEIKESWYDDEKMLIDLLKLLEDMSDDEIIKKFPKQYYCGDHVIMWEIYNEGVDCFSDYTTGLEKYFDVKKLYNDWDDEFTDFIKGLS
tara:strand:- start:531 stop:1049 length:519 start_codon:yes stop_codon:yes gene_type:complete